MKIINCKSLPCPQPVILCRNTLQQEDINELCVIVDNEPAKENISKYLTQQGFSISVSSKDNTWEVCGKRSKEAQSSSAKQIDSATTNKNSQSTSLTSKNKKKILVFITSNLLGSGDDALGSKLMENFILTLPEMGEDLWSIIFVNSGVSLTTSKNASLNTLKDLEKSGVNILACGTCLAHFGLSELKEVGESANMLDIVTSLAVADSVIRP